MVQVTPEREVYTERIVDDSGPATAMVVMFSLLIIAVLGFMVYYFSNANMSNSLNPTTIIERTQTNTHTTTPLPVPTPTPVAPAEPTPAPEASTP
jgi:cytoskeletal protein RodZ